MDLDDAVPGRRYMCIAYTCTTYALHHTQSDAKDAQLQSGTAVIMQGWSIAAPGLVARSETPGRASGWGAALRGRVCTHLVQKHVGSVTNRYFGSSLPRYQTHTHT